jgi:proteasome accessory factor B
VTRRKLDPLERQSELFLLLLLTDGGLTREQIADRMPDYPPGFESMRKALHRDKDALLEAGVPVRMETRADGVSYDVRREDYYLPELDLSFEEQLALDLALAVVRVGETSPEDTTLLKLNAAPPDAQLLVAVPDERGLPEMHAALRQRAAVAFRYNGEARDVELWAVRFQGGHWYAVGFDRLRSAQRVFRVDRIDGQVTTARPGTVVVPTDFDPETAVTDQANLPGSEPAVAEVWVDALHVPLVADARSDAMREDRSDGSVVFRFPISHWGAFRSWLLGFGDHARVLGPPELRADVLGWLQAIAETT